MASATIVYDQDCGFCLRSLDWVRERDRERVFEAVGCQSEARRQRFPGIAEAACLRQMYLVEADGRTLAGGDAAAAILRRLPGYGLLGVLLAAPGLRHAIRAAYRVLARNRRRLGCSKGHCEI